MKETKSLLSKIAFLVKASVFVLYDRLAKDGLWTFQSEDTEIKRKQYDSYKGYYICFNKLLNELQKQKCSDAANKILDKSFKGTEAHSYFTKNKKAFELRVVDKILWIRGQPEGAREINNKPYLSLLK